MKVYGAFVTIVVSCMLHLSYGKPHFFVNSASGINSAHTILRHKREANLTALPPPTVSRYHVTSTVTARYVSTSAVVTLTNDAEESQEVNFVFKLTPEAFISGFVMIVDGISYQARVEEKEVAQKAYNEARRRGQGAAQVRQSSKSETDFAIDLNVEGGTFVIFNLTFQELLRRDKGIFTHIISVVPSEVVDDLRVEVLIIEPQGLTTVEASWEPSNEPLHPMVNFLPESTQANILLTPSAALQSSISPKGLEGKLVVRYDVNHELNGGDLQIVNGYFVHHISPEGIPPAPKTVIFVIDVSGSMSGLKLSQTISALVSILGELRRNDKFNIIIFSTSARLWRPKVVQATSQTVDDGIAFVRNLRSESSTNIHSALLLAVEGFDQADEGFPAIIFLTDGKANVGISEPNAIVDSINSVIGDRIALFCIGFGSDVDEFLLKRLAAENQGLYRKVFEDSDANLQIRGFFDEVATPLLYNIAIRYENNAVDTNSLTGTQFISYFDGNELIVAGRLADGYHQNLLNAVVSGYSRDGLIEFQVSKEIDEETLNPDMVEDFAQRMWAFLTIKDLLRRIELSISESDKSELKAKALELSLRYEFVTSLTSLLVIKPSKNQSPTAVPYISTQRPPIFDESSVPSSSIAQNPFVAYAAIPSGGPPLPSYYIAHDFLVSYDVISQGGRSLPTSSIAHYQFASYSAISKAFPLRRLRVGGDPHFVIDIPHSNITICFDFQGEEGKIINLIDDPILDLTVNAQLIHAEFDQSATSNTQGKPNHSLIGRLGMRLGPYLVDVLPQHILLDYEIKLPWDEYNSILMGNYNITVNGNHILTITLGNCIVMRTEIRKRHNHPDHFDFVLENGRGLSRDVHGLIGQFEYKSLSMTNAHEGMSKSGHVRGVMKIDGEDKFIYKVQKKVQHHAIKCWWSSVENYIDGEPEEYFVPDLYSTLKQFEYSGIRSTNY